MPDQNAPVRLGAALIVGDDACHAVHVHTSPDGIARIVEHIQRLDTEALGLPPGEYKNLTAVLGGSDVKVRVGRVALAAVESLVAGTLAEDEGAGRD